ncbi:MAG: radical SAM/SPASM domain-containing protein [Candidatus Aenigmatarchaeota archaeon]
MKELVRRLRKWKKGKEAAPLICQVHLTNKCNLSCGFCPTVASKEEGELDVSNELGIEKWMEIVREGKEMGVDEWHICGGGEPFFDKDKAKKIMEKMKESGARGEVITNGTLVDEEIAEMLVNIGWDLVTFSIDGPDAETNDKIRSEGSFRQAVKNAKYLSRIRDNSEPYLVVHTVICNENYKKPEEMVKLVDEIGFDEIRFNSMNVWNETGEKLKLDESKRKEAKENLIEARKMTEKRNVESNIDEFVKHNLLEHSNEIDEAMKEGLDGKGEKFSNLPCYYPWYNFSIFADGRAAPCFLFQKGDNIKNKSLEEVWKGGFFNRTRERFLENKLKDVCKNCNAWNVEKMREIRKELN